MNFAIATSISLTPHHQSFFGGFFLTVFLLFVNIDNNFLNLNEEKKSCFHECNYNKLIKIRPSYIPGI